MINVFFALLFVAMVIITFSVGLFYQFYWGEAFSTGLTFLLFLLVCLYISRKNIRTCSKCGNEIKFDAKFCESCGTCIYRFCPSCKTKIKGMPRYCKNCGFNLSVEPNGEISKEIKSSIATSEEEPISRFCPGCGSKIRANDKFCSSCGIEI